MEERPGIPRITSLNNNIMAKKTDSKAKAPKKLSLLEALSAKGVVMSEKKSTLWDEPDMVDITLEADEVEIRVKEYDNGDTSLYAILREGDMSRAVGFAPGELETNDVDVDDLDTDDDGIVTNWKHKIQLGIVTALRDDNDLSYTDLENVKHSSISEGDQSLKAYIQ